LATYRTINLAILSILSHMNSEALIYRIFLRYFNSKISSCKHTASISL